MNVHPKFIIETDDIKGDCLIISKCTYHKQLVTDSSKVKGGGWWSLDIENELFTLFGESVDFGMAKIEDISNCIKNHNVYRDRALSINLCDDGYRFNYKHISGEIINLNF